MRIKQLNVLILIDSLFIHSLIFCTVPVIISLYLSITNSIVRWQAYNGSPSRPSRRRPCLSQRPPRGCSFKDFSRSLAPVALPASEPGVIGGCRESNLSIIIIYLCDPLFNQFQPNISCFLNRIQSCTMSFVSRSMYAPPADTSAGRVAVSRNLVTSGISVSQLWV